jgi:hypothetical protein
MKSYDKARRQKDISKLLREKKQAHFSKLKASKKKAGKRRKGK